MVSWARDGRTWRIGTDAQVAWIANGTSTGRAITAAIPPLFEAYATVVLPYAGEGQDKHDRAVLALLSKQSRRLRGEGQAAAPQRGLPRDRLTPCL